MGREDDRQGAASPACPVCRTPTKVRFRALYDDRYGYPGCFDLHRCPGCGHQHLTGAFPPDGPGPLYRDHYPRAAFDPAAFRPAREARGTGAWWRGERRRAHAWVPPGVAVLDVGCGLGETLAYHASRGCRALGVDVDPNVAPNARAHGLDLRIAPFESAGLEAESFDYLTMDQVIEHAADPGAALRQTARVLRPGGRAVLSTPNGHGWGARVFGRRWIHWHVPYHRQWFTERSMRLAAEGAGLVLLRAETITSSEWLHYQWLALATFPGPGAPSAFWSPRAHRSHGVRLAILALRGLHATGFDHLATRAWDTASAGDNWLFVLGKR